MKTLASRLRSAREKAGLRPADLDAKAHLSAGHTGLIESRRRRDPYLSTAVALAKALDVSLDWLASGTPYSGKPDDD